MTPEQFKSIRVDKGYSQTQLAKAIGLTVGTISRIENGRGNITNPIAKLMELLPASHRGELK